jgi:hypothetical protein
MWWKERANGRAPSSMLTLCAAESIPGRPVINVTTVGLWPKIHVAFYAAAAVSLLKENELGR